VLNGVERLARALPLAPSRGCAPIGKAVSQYRFADSCDAGPPTAYRWRGSLWSGTSQTEILGDSTAISEIVRVPVIYGTSGTPSMAGRRNVPGQSPRSRRRRVPGSERRLVPAAGSNRALGRYVWRRDTRGMDSLSEPDTYSS
jgi:hypothetical protein